MTKDQLKQIKVSRFLPGTNGGAFEGAKNCMFNVFDQGNSYSYTATVVTTEGIGPWLEGKRNVESKLVSVEGYAAAQYHLPGEGESIDCSTSVDVAEGQQLVIRMTPITTGKFSQDQVCQLSEQAAGLAMTTLQASR